MATQRIITMKPTFFTDILSLAPKEMQQVISKVNQLCQDPIPDGKVKKHLTHEAGRPYRFRSGDYRIFYKFDATSINLLTVCKRDESTYKHGVEADDLNFDPGLAGLEEPDGDVVFVPSQRPEWQRSYQEVPASKQLPEPITVELLNHLHVPPQCHQRLLPLKTQDEVLSCPGVPDEILLRIDQYMFDLPLIHIEQQPDLILNDPQDLLRYKEGELLSFLLKLSPEQEKYVRWPLNSAGSMLVKGGPGTGKSTIALYRVRSILDQLLLSNPRPRVLFTTYTNALIKSSEQLLQQLLGERARYVEVQTADKLAYQVLQQVGQTKDIIGREQRDNLLFAILANPPLTGNPLQQQAQRQTLARLGSSYLQQEMTRIIIARQLETLEEYQATPRTGRKLRLNALQRELVWKIYEEWRKWIEATGQETWQQRRARAAAVVSQSSLYQHYDAVIIDEAQDLDPSVLRLLIQLCVSPNRLFITADANQSIYGSGFTWTDVHQDLKFQGRTNILRANYRSTREIDAAAYSYLATGVLENEEIERTYSNSGPIPAVRAVRTNEYEAQLLANFFRNASRDLRLTLGSCAVLCPSERAGRGIAATLGTLGIEATYMSSQDLDLAHSGVKVLTLNAAKGLEFPIVALAGFVSSTYPVIPRDTSPEGREEIAARERRTMFVGMTRAMRALLVVVPTETKSPLLQGFDPRHWNMG